MTDWQELVEWMRSPQVQEAAARYAEEPEEHDPDSAAVNLAALGEGRNTPELPVELAPLGVTVKQEPGSLWA